MSGWLCLFWAAVSAATWAFAPDDSPASKMPNGYWFMMTVIFFCTAMVLAEMGPRNKP